MNLFEYYKSEIIKIVKNNEKELNILTTDNYKGVLVKHLLKILILIYQVIFH